MPRSSFARSLFAAALLFCFSAAAIAASDITPFNFHSENGQIGFTLKKDFHPVIAEIELQVVHVNRKVFEARVAGDQMLNWPTRNSIPEPGQSPEYGFRLAMKDHDGAWLNFYGYFYRDGGKLTFALSQQRAGLAGPTPLEFYKTLTEKAPSNAAAWLFYGVALTVKHENKFVFFASAPPPPPPAPPPPPPGAKEIKLSPMPPIPKDTAEDLKRYEEEDRQHKANEAAMREDLAAAVLPAIRKAYDLANDCQTKDAAMLYLNRIAVSLNNRQEARQWLLKRAESDCASKESVAESYYALGVEEWSCAYGLIEKYTNPKLKAADPFHFRAMTNSADKRQFDACLAAGFQHIEKALAANPNYVDAMFYKSLLYREKQKATADPDERKKLGDEAMKIAERAGKIQSGR